MKNLTKFTMTIMSFAVFAVGCGKGSSFSLLETEDSFKQTSGTANSKIDILWVIDNSGSMDSSQTNLVNNLNSFITDFSAKGLDYRMAVTTTDAFSDVYSGGTKCSVFRDGPLDFSCRKIAGKTYSAEPVITFLSADPIGAFNINGKQGISGSGDERAFQSMKTALNNPNNNGFLRADSFLTVIIVSDEDDMSHDGNFWLGSYTDTKLHTPQSYVDYLDALTNSTSANRRYNVNAMAIWQKSCLDTLDAQYGGRQYGTRYGQLVDIVNSAFTVEETKGLKSSLCGNFAVDLGNIADGIISLASRFELARLPDPATISVKVNGVVVPKSTTNPLADGGWVYEEATNSILFTGNYIPQAGSNINVNYDPLYYGG